MALLGSSAALVVFGRPTLSRTLKGSADAAAQESSDVSFTAIPRVPFTDVTTAAGIFFVHENGARGDKLLPETMGGGCAFFDFDCDGDQDLLLVNSRPWPDQELLGQERTTGKSLPTTALYRNDGRGAFDDVTAGSGLDVALYGMGAAVGDYDNDGRPDVFLSALGANKLFRNAGDGRFVDVTETAGVAGDAAEWSTGSGWFDYDNDGDLDLFVCNYVKWSRELDVAHHFRLPWGAPAYGRPQNFQGASPYLYRNDGHGRFTDVSAEAGIDIRDADGTAVAKSLGITFDDFDGDGRLDVVVANDTTANQCFRNCGDGTFEEIGVLTGIAFDRSGKARGAMGIDTAYFRNDDAVGVAVGNFSQEMAALYVARGNRMQFEDEAHDTHLGPATQRESTFGICYLDYDLDGRLDLLAANGHLEPEIGRVQPTQHYRQAPQLFWNAGAGHPGELLAVPIDRCGRDFARPMVGRGASFADIDGDGDLDALLTAAGQSPRLLRNDQNLGHHWLRLTLIGTGCNRSAIGAMIEVRVETRTLRRRVMPTRSYLSQVELPITIGLGRAESVRSVKIHWPDGMKQTLPDLAVDRAYEIEQPREAASSPSASSRSASSPSAAFRIRATADRASAVGTSPVPQLRLITTYALFRSSNR